MKNIQTILQQDFNTSTITSRLIDLIIQGTYYFKVVIGSQDYYFNSFLSPDRIAKFYFETLGKVLFLVDNRFYIFDKNSGRIEMLIRLWSCELELKLFNDLAVIITEREVYKIDIKNSILHSLVSLSDIIINYHFKNDILILECFDGEKLNIVI